MSILLGVVVDDRWVRAESGTSEQQLKKISISAFKKADKRWVKAESGESENQLKDNITRALPMADKRIFMIKWTNDDEDNTGTGFHWYSYFTSTSISVPRLDCSYLFNELLHIGLIFCEVV